MASRVLFTRLSSAARSTALRSLTTRTFSAAANHTSNSVPEKVIRSNASRNAYVAIACMAGAGFGATVAYAAAPTGNLSKEEIATAVAAINDLLDQEENEDLGATIVRLAWHSSGTYDKNSGTGGSDGAKMRFKPESGHGANAGLNVAREALEPIKKKLPNMTYVQRVYCCAPVVSNPPSAKSTSNNPVCFPYSAISLVQLC